MKNHRNVCCATTAGCTTYIGLQGKVQTGCPNTPAYRSPYCTVHKPVISVQKGADAGSNKEKPVGLVIAKKETRNSTFYQVILYRPHNIPQHIDIRRTFKVQKCVLYSEVRTFNK